MAEAFLNNLEKVPLLGLIIRFLRARPRLTGMLRRLIWAARTLVLATVLWASGYHIGMCEYARDPQRTEMNLVTELLSSSGASGIVRRDDPHYQRLQKILDRLVPAALIVWQERLDVAKAEHGEDSDEVETIKSAIRLLKQKWRIVSLDPPTPTASPPPHLRVHTLSAPHSHAAHTPFPLRPNLKLAILASTRARTAGAE